MPIDGNLLEAMVKKLNLLPEKPRELFFLSFYYYFSRYIMIVNCYVRAPSFLFIYLDKTCKREVTLGTFALTFASVSVHIILLFSRLDSC